MIGELEIGKVGDVAGIRELGGCFEDGGTGVSRGLSCDREVL